MLARAPAGGARRLSFTTDQRTEAAKAKLAQIMKHKLMQLSQRYVTALRKHLKQGPCASLESARGMGRQAELEAQNVELQDDRERMEVLLDKYTNLYDFAPAGYFSLDKQGRILEVNLTGAALLGVARSRLIGRSLPQLAVPGSQPIVLAFLKMIYCGTGKQSCQATLLRKGGAPFWAGLHGVCAGSLSAHGKTCRVAVLDITPLKQAEEAERRIEALAVANRELKHLSGHVLRAQEEERKRISRELHDVIAQTLTGVNLRLEALRKDVALSATGLEGSVARA